MSDQEDDAEYNRAEQHRGDGNKKVAKIQRHFAYSLLTESVNEGWESHETCQLILLLAKLLNFDSNKITHCLLTTNLATPEMIALLGDNNIVFEPGQVFDLLQNQAKNSNHFIKIVSGALECDILPLYQDETLEKLASLLKNGTMEGADAIRYGMTICGFAQTKAVCGHILDALTYAMEVSDAVSYIHDIITRDFFLDLTGNMQQFLPELKKPEVRNFLKEILEESNITNSKGEIVASDEDSDGNLEGFVAPSDEENTESDNYFDDEALESENDDGGDEYFQARTKLNASESSDDRSKQHRKRVIDDTLDEDNGEDNDEDNKKNPKSKNRKKSTGSNELARRRVVVDDEEEEEDDECIGSSSSSSSNGRTQKQIHHRDKSESGSSLKVLRPCCGSKIWSDDDDDEAEL